MAQECIVSTSLSTAITCNTGAYSSSSVTAPVLVFIQNAGYATNVSLFHNFIYFVIDPALLFIAKFSPISIYWYY